MAGLMLYVRVALCLVVLSSWPSMTSAGAPVALADQASVRSSSVSSAASAASAPKLDVATVVDRVQKRYDGAGDFRARFNQTLNSAAFKRQTSLTGEVLLKKPGRMRWNYQTPETKMYLADGDLLWLYEPDDRQAFKQDLRSSQLPAALAFLTGKGKLATEFDISFAKDSRVGGPDDYVLSLSPRQPQSQVRLLLFVVDPRTFQVRESMITDQQGNTNDMLFSDIKINSHIADATFKWAPPPGTRVIDAGKLGR